MSTSIRVSGALAGNIISQADMAAKYGGLFDSLARQFDLQEVYDARLRGFQRAWNALQTFSPSMTRWKEHYFKNPAAFEMRSRMAQKHFRGMRGRTDVVFQLGALFDSAGEQAALPVVVYTDHTTSMTVQHPNTSRNPFTPAELKRWLAHEKQLYQRAAHICTRAQVVRRSLIEDYSVPAERVTVIGGGVNFEMSTRPGLKTRKADAAFTVLFIGADFERKGGDYLLHAFSLVRRLYPDARLNMVTRHSVPAGLPLEGVHVLPLTWDRRQIEALYQQADVFVLPSRHETWGDVLLEAMSFGVPCIGTAGQAMDEIIVHGKTGFLVESEQVEDLARAIIQLLEQPELRQRMGLAARQLVDQEFTWERVVERLTPIIAAVTCQIPVSSRTSLLERMSV